VTFNDMDTIHIHSEKTVKCGRPVGIHRIGYGDNCSDWPVTRRRYYYNY